MEARQVRPPPAVDGLIIVAGEGQRPVRGGERLDERVLQGAQVLRLVDQHRPEAGPQRRPHGRLTGEQRERLRQQIQEVERVRLAAPGLIGDPERRDRGPCRVHRAWGARDLGGPRPLQGLDERGQVALEAQVLREAGDEATGVVAVQDREGGRPTHRRRVAPQEPGPEPVEGAGPEGPRVPAERVGDAPAQLVRGRSGEGEGEDRGRLDLLVLDQPLDPVGQDPGLAAAGPAGEQQGPGRVGDGRALARVQGRQRLVEGPDPRAALG